MQQGYIHALYLDRNFGFVRCIESGEAVDTFFHFSDFNGDRAVLARNVRVAFDVVTYRVRGSQAEKTKAINVSLVAPKPQPETPYEPAPAPPSAPKQPRIAGQAKTILATDDAPRPAYATATATPASAVAALAEATAPKTDAPNDGGIRE
jgi:cold shock CspA family protein